MAFLKSQRSKFIAWMVIYALVVGFILSKGFDEGRMFLWGLALGAGIGIGITIVGPPAKQKRLLIVLTWFVSCWILQMGLFWNDLRPKGSYLEWERVLTGAFVTLIGGFPASLALLVWIFRRPKLT